MYGNITQTTTQPTMQMVPTQPITTIVVQQLVQPITQKTPMQPITQVATQRTSIQATT